MDVILLAVILLGIFSSIYLLFGRDIFSPSVLFCLSYFVSTICCIYNKNDWGVNLELKTIFLIICSIISFIIGEFLIKYLFKEKNNNRDIQIKYINVPKSKMLIIILINIVLTFCLYKEVVRIASINYANWGNLIYNFKTNANNIEGLNINLWVAQGLKISKAFAYIYIFIFINNIFAEKSKKETKRNLLNLIPIIFVMGQSLLKGVRVAILTILFAIIFIWYIFMQIRKNWDWSLNIKTILKICIIALIVCSLFYYSKGVVGRMQEDTGVLKYVTTYLGGPIELLNLFVKDGVNETNNTIETMGGLVSSLQKLGLFTKYNVNPVREYRNSLTGYPLGNVYGAIRDYYHDFGFVGAQCCVFMLSIFINTMYYSIKNRKNMNIKKPTLLIIYSTFVYAIFFLTFADFVTAKFALGVIIEMILIAICKIYILGKSVRE